METIAQETVIYNGRIYRRHPKQPYFYNTNSKPYRSLHRQMWFDAFGSIPEDMDVHHVNENPSDNRVENFALKKKRDHQKEHGRQWADENPEKYLKLAAIGREHAKLWHSSDEGREWHRNHAKEKQFGKFDYGTSACEQCGGVYNKKTKRSRFCSNACKSNWRRKNNPDRIMKQCPTCGKEYETFKYNSAKYCSKSCTPAPNPNGRRKA